MGKAMAEAFASAREVFAQADESLGFPLSRICFEGPEDRLRLTEITQPAILAASVACLRPLCECGARPVLVAGHSLGEYSALVCAESISLPDAIRIVSRRGRYMQEAVPVGTGAMAAILGMAPGKVEELCRECAEGEVLSAANYNSPEQTVIAGTAAAVARAVAAAPARGAKRAITLPVSAPFHCELMRPARERLATDLGSTTFSAPRVPLVANVDAGIRTSAAELPATLGEQVTSPVRWDDSVRAMAGRGVTTFVEVGPGRVLGGLIRRIAPSTRTLHVEDPMTLEKTLAALEA
jgi:[acyl-carrier-protein] S-malonyltransferase